MPDCVKKSKHFNLYYIIKEDKEIQLRKIKQRRIKLTEKRYTMTLRKNESKRIDEY